MKQKNNPKRKYGWFFQEGLETVVIIVNDVKDFSFACGCHIDKLIVKKEIWESNEDMRYSLIPCLTDKNDLILM